MRIRTFIATLAIALLTLVGPATASTVRVATYSMPRYEMFTETLLPMWKAKYPDINIEIEMFAGTGDMQNKLTVALGTDLVPDIVDTAGTLFFSHVVVGAVVDLEPHLAKVVDISYWLPHVIDEVRYPYGSGKGIYGLPYDWVGSVMLYNRELYRRSGLAFPDESWTWDDLRADAQSIARDNNGDGINDVWGFYLPALDHMRFDPLVRAYGGQVLSEDRREAVFGPTGADEVLQLYLDMIHEDGSTNPVGVAAPFNQGATGIYLAGTWELRTIDPAGIDYGVVMVPQGPVARSMYGGSNLWVVMKRPSQDIDAVMRILAELVSFDTVSTTSSEYNLPSRRSHIAQWDLTPASAVLAASAPYMRDGEWTPDWSLWQVAKRNELQPVLTMERPIPEGLQKAVEAVDRILSEVYK